MIKVILFFFSLALPIACYAEDAVTGKLNALAKSEAFNAQSTPPSTPKKEPLKKIKEATTSPIENVLCKNAPAKTKLNTQKNQKHATNKTHKYRLATAMPISVETQQPLTVDDEQLQAEPPEHGQALFSRLAKESVEEEPESLLSNPPGPEHLQSSDNLSYEQRRDFSGSQTTGLKWIKDPPPMPRPIGARSP